MLVSQPKRTEKKMGITGLVATLLYMLTLVVIVLFWCNNSIDFWR
ncbi:hypothetical protein VOA_003311 [Vibrio sp. RC586]|nr:hypothetical protein [Vibrio sp. RC586]EEZ01308.1 hypothetical protein VOA_003311 [Vibrio sp. RC586]